MKALIVGATPAMAQVIQAAISQAGVAIEVVEVENIQAAVSMRGGVVQAIIANVPLNAEIVDYDNEEGAAAAVTASGLPSSNDMKPENLTSYSLKQFAMKVMLVGGDQALSQVIQAAIVQAGAPVDVIELDAVQMAVSVRGGVVQDIISNVPMDVVAIDYDDDEPLPSWDDLAKQMPYAIA